MEIVQFLGVALAAYIAVAAKAFQQLNVIHDYRKLVPVFSLIMGTCEVVLAGNIAIRAVGADIWGLVFTILAMALGGASGALTSMALHKRMRKNGGKDGSH